ncbi:MAG: hypothetical protein P0S95_00965 [Rhabdochlamydiaceae bacterium]|nr:hypothetical protein [Candidatus Amphrikana amoebophyrae]
MKIKLLPPISDGKYTLKGCQVTFNPLPMDPELNEVDRKKCIELIKLVESKPKLARKELASAFRNNPYHPAVLNLQTFCEVQLKRVRKADCFITTNYEKNPHSVLAVLNYGDMLLRKRQMKKFEAIFKDKMDIGDLFLGHTLFYSEDARAFYALMGFYHIKMKNKALASLYYSNAYKLNSTHLSVLHLERKLAKKVMWNNIKRFFAQKLKPVKTS